MAPLAIEFFATFARFEFALKRSGFLGGPIGGKAEANWDTFANALGLTFLARMSKASAAAIFFEAAPKIMKRISTEHAEFVEAEVIDTAAKLFVSVRRVRNNLFHGEKPNLNARDEQLVVAALFVLDSAMAACAAIGECHRVPGAFQYEHVTEH